MRRANGIRRRDHDGDGAAKADQHRDKRSTGVRLTHRPTGLVLYCTERRSQQRNLDAAGLISHQIMVGNIEVPEAAKPGRLRLELPTATSY